MTQQNWIDTLLDDQWSQSTQGHLEVSNEQLPTGEIFNIMTTIYSEDILDQLDIYWAGIMAPNFYTSHQKNNANSTW